MAYCIRILQITHFLNKKIRSNYKKTSKALWMILLAMVLLISPILIALPDAGNPCENTLSISAQCQGESVITGKAKTFGFGNHAWNAIKIDSVWRLVDACWGAGGYRGNRFIKSKNLFYFFTPPEELILTHYPDFEEYQFLKNPVSREQFFGAENVGYSPVMYTLLLAEVSDYSYAEMIATNVVTGYGRAVITYDPSTKKYLIYSGQFNSEKEAIEASKTVENCIVKKLSK